MNDLTGLLELFFPFLFCLGVTCIIEGAVAFCMKIRKGKAYLLIFFVNMLTNPLANLLYSYGVRRITLQAEKGISFLYGNFGALPPAGSLWLVLEMMVIFCEAWIYHRFQEWIAHPVRYAVAANVLSAAFGLIWQN